MKKTFSILLALLSINVYAQKVYEISDFGLKCNSKQNASAIMQKAIAEIRSEYRQGDSIVLRFPKGEYNFYEKGAALRQYYISNHDQGESKSVGIALEDLEHFTLDGQGSQFIFHGRMIPLAMLRSESCTLRDFSIDFKRPHIAQVQVVENRGAAGLVIEVAPWVNYRITKDSLFETYDDGWAMRHNTGIAFEEGSKRLVYQTSDLSYSTRGVTEISSRRLHTPQWVDPRLTPGTVVAMRSWYRPTPGVFMSHNTSTKLLNVKVHYAEGMGLVAQLCNEITLDGFSVCLKGDSDPRYFTAQADATHFSSCKGKITSINGLYENMMDDAINIHGTYLKVTKRIDDRTLIGRYMHSQSWGFEWGVAGDQVQFVLANTMELVGQENRIASIRPHDKATLDGAREFHITFDSPLDTAINQESVVGIENLTWTPEVLFANNVIRNNRARGTLFSTPRPTIIENNLFDHTSGTAILLCGDCNGWFETGACRQVTIRNNHFINALTNIFQFSSAIISIYPEIPNLDAQQKYFHGGPQGGIIIENNIFDTFDTPLLYAKSVDGLIFRNNILKRNNAYKPFHPNQSSFLLERVTNAQISTPTLK